MNKKRFIYGRTRRNKYSRKKPFYKTTKGIIAMIAVCCVGVLLLFFIASALSPDKITTDSSSSSSEDNINQFNDDSSNADSAASASGYQVRITYDGAWQGAVGSTGSTTSYDGSGSKTIDLGEVSYDIVSASIQKNGFWIWYT